MKRILYFAIAAIACCACNDLIEMPAPGSEEGQNQPIPVPEDQPVTGDVVFTATLADLVDGSHPAWQGGDQILLWDGAVEQILTNSEQEGAIARFPGKIAKGDEIFVAVSPALEGIQFAGQTVSCVLPVMQSAATPMPWIRIAKSGGTTLSFLPATSRINFSIDFDGATKVLFKTAGEKIAGNINVDYSGNLPSVIADSDQVEITGSFAKGQTYSFTVLPGTIQSYSVVVFAGEEEKAHISGDAVSALPGLTAELPLFKEDNPTYQIAHMWVWGGTGPEYDCSKIYDMLAKPGCFNSEDGRGIEALRDNYYVMGTDGSFMNYAGEDGRNWWFVYSGEQNPENGKDVDVRSFYDVLPLKGGFWALDGQTFTFTFEDGHTSTATLLAPGSYDMPGTSPTKTLVLEKQALMFQISGGKDNWNFPWQDYGVFVCRPRALFIELDKLPDGFVVPEASRTTDADFEYVPPVDPGSMFDWNSLPGNWEVYGGNSSPYGIWVLGGSGDDPAFISPIDKSWDWDDSIWKESDNMMVIADIVVSGTQITGTTNWWAGNDGGWWNYTWKATGDDLSGYYNKIPKGQYGFTFDLATLTLTWSNNTTAKFLIPGEHEFKYTGDINVSKSLTVPDNCFGLHFHNMDPIPATSERWTDVDRFVNAPLDYVIIFEKTQ